MECVRRRKISGRKISAGYVVLGVMMFFGNSGATGQSLGDAFEELAQSASQEADQGLADEEEEETAPSADPVDLEQAEVVVSPTGTVTLNVVDLPLSTVLRVLSLQTNRNIITSPSVDGAVTASLNDVTFEEALDAILVSNRAAYRVVGKFIYVYSEEEIAEIIARENPPIPKIILLNYIPAKDAKIAVSPLLSKIGEISESTEPSLGIDSTSTDAGGASLATSDYLVVYDYPENVAAIENLLANLDVRPKQVLVEATIMSAELSDQNALGVDFTLLGGVDLELLNSTSQAVQDVTLGALPASRFDDLNANATTTFTKNVPNGGVRIGILSDKIAVFVEALERITDTVVLANPKILALNKQKGQVIVGRRDGYITTTVTQTQSIQTVQFLETGTQLIFRPYVGDDGFIRMELHPEDSIGGLTAANLPFEKTTEVTTNVIIRDGQTIMIGGLFREVDTDTRAQIPLLGDMPLLGTLFQSRNDDLKRQEVIILLTVHVIKDFDSYAKKSREQFEHIERLRVGIREGQMWFGRERMAQSLYQKAVQRFAAGNDADARWYVRMALYNNPLSVPAIELQEELRRKRAWDEDGAATRNFIYEVIMNERGIAEPLFGRPAPPFVRPGEITNNVGADATPAHEENSHGQG